MGCCKSKYDSEPEFLPNSKNISILEPSSENEKVKERNLAVSQIQIVDEHEGDNQEIPTTRRQDLADTNRTNVVLIPEADEGIKPKKKMKSNIAISVVKSEPQNLNPNNVYFVENKNVPLPTKIKQEKINQVILRQETVDRILQEKIQNKVDFEELLSDHRFEKFIK